MLQCKRFFFLIMYCGAIKASGLVASSASRPGFISFFCASIAERLAKENVEWHDLETNKTFYQSINDRVKLKQHRPFQQSVMSYMHPYKVGCSKKPFFIYNRSQQNGLVFKYRNWDKEILKTWLLSPHQIKEIIKTSYEFKEASKKMFEEYLAVNESLIPFEQKLRSLLIIAAEKRTNEEDELVRSLSEYILSIKTKYYKQTYLLALYFGSHENGLNLPFLERDFINSSATNVLNLIQINKNITEYNKFHPDNEISLPPNFALVTEPCENDTFIVCDRSLSMTIG